MTAVRLAPTNNWRTPSWRRSQRRSTSLVEGADGVTATDETAPAETSREKEATPTTPPSPEPSEDSEGERHRRRDSSGSSPPTPTTTGASPTRALSTNSESILFYDWRGGSALKRSTGDVTASFEIGSALGARQSETRRDGLFCTNSCAKPLDRIQIRSFGPSLDLVTKSLRQNGSELVERALGCEASTGCPGSGRVG